MGSEEDWRKTQVGKTELLQVQGTKGATNKNLEGSR